VVGVSISIRNESPQDVFFDDITVKHTTGPLQQEQSFYPYGLQMSPISSKALLKTTDPYKYNAGSELEEELGYYNTFFRKYDAQIGRFTGVDVRSEESAGMSVYNFAANNPIMFNDPLGDKYTHMDSHGNKWHGRYILAGTAAEGTQFSDGNGFDGFGDMGFGNMGGRSYNSFWNGLIDAFSGEDGEPQGTIVDRVGNLISKSFSHNNGVFLKDLLPGQYKFLGTLGGTILADGIFSNLLFAHLQEVINGLARTLHNFNKKGKGGGDWDLKKKDRTIWNEADKMSHDGSETLFLFREFSMRAEDLGNFHYGVLAKMFNLSEIGVLKAAGITQMSSGSSNAAWQTPEMMKKYYGDDPIDQGWIKNGFSFYIKYYNF